MDTETPQATKQPITAAPGKRKQPASKPANAPSKRTVNKPAAQTQSKQDRVVAMLSRKEGATVASIMKVTGWQKHSVHSFFAGVVRKKLGLNLVSDKSDGERVYRVSAGKDIKARRKTTGRRAG